jgi:malonate-semialdehyde dehydrogenase (acetylating)/methylmalonate-semialdehyde dehydrogenase
MAREVQHFISGSMTKGEATRHGEIFNPNTGEVQAHVCLGTATDLDSAVKAAQKVQPEWAATNPQRRARVMFKFKQLLEDNMDELAALLSSEHGKVIADSKGDIQRGLEVIEFACGIPHLLKGEYTEGAGPGIDIYAMRQPLGVVAGITPFNFPAMIPMWMFGIAIACGNGFILKPSEKDPSVPVRLAELMVEAGAPEGLLNVVHGDKEVVDAILTHPDIKAVSFVGSSDIAHYVYQTGTAHGKRVQAMGCRYGPSDCRFLRFGLWLGRRTLHGPAGRRAGRQGYGG